MPIEDWVHPYLGSYTAAPQWVKTIVGSVYSRFPVQWRYGSAYQGFLEEVRRSQSDGEWARQQAAHKLQEMLDWALCTVPVYRDLSTSLSSVRDPYERLAAFPLVSKADLKAHPGEYLSDRMPPSTWLMAHTGGSTSVPMALYLQKFVSRSKDFAYNGEFDRLAGIDRQSVVLALRGRTVPGSDKPNGPIWMFDPIKRYLHLSSDHLEPAHMTRYLEAIHKFKPDFVHAFPSAILPLAQWLIDHPAPAISDRIRCVQLFSENIYDYQIEIIKRAFRNAPVLLDFGHSERAVKAISFPDDSRYHFWPLYGHIELIDASGTAIKNPGQLGEIVATGFDNKVMPLIRYRTGDLAMWSASGSLKRPGFQIVDRIEGRLQELLVCRDARLVSITTIGAAHFEQLANADLMQFEQSEPGKALLKVVSAQPLGESAKAALRQGIFKKTQGGLDIEVVQVDSIARTSSGKHRLLVQQLDLTRYLGAVHVSTQ
jgi:phenylacetate-CoA ligase